MFKRFKLVIILLLLTIPSYIYAYSDYVIASGENIGIKLKTKGIIVIGKYDDTNISIKEGDIIVSLEGNDNINIESLTNYISNNSIETINIGYIRNGKLYNTNLKVKNGKTGLYLKDTIAGIGTLTFIDPNTKIYGALGHEIIDSTSGYIIDSSGGNIFDSKVINIIPSDRGTPGEKNASINSNNTKGDIDSNTNKGIFGDYIDNISKNNLYKVGNINNIKLGKAYMLTELDNNKVDKYEIEIIKIDKNDKTKNIMFRVIDDRLLKLGGIVQGMSGSPIIQDNYIIGAVTHVVIDDPKRGYGILITNMLEEAEKKDD